MANEALRAVALSEAGKLGLKTPAEVLSAAGTYLAFLTDEPKGAAQSSSPGSDAAPPVKATGTAPAKPAGATKPKAAAPAKKLVPEKTEEEKAAEALAAAEADTPEGDEIDWTGEAGQQEVGKAVSALIAGGKRPDAIALLGEFKAASVSGVKPADREKFVAKATELLSGEADITA